MTQSKCNICNGDGSFIDGPESIAPCPKCCPEDYELYRKCSLYALMVVLILVALGVLAAQLVGR